MFHNCGMLMFFQLAVSYNTSCTEMLEAFSTPSCHALGSPLQCAEPYLSLC